MMVGFDAELDGEEAARGRFPLEPDNDTDEAMEHCAEAICADGAVILFHLHKPTDWDSFELVSSQHGGAIVVLLKD